MTAANALVTAGFHLREGTSAGSLIPDFDVSNFPFDGALTYVEVIIVSPFAGTHAGNAHTTQLVAAHCAEQVKARKYNSFAGRMNHGLAVLAVETTGGIW